MFGGWDIFEEDTYAAARTAGVLEPTLLDKVSGTRVVRLMEKGHCPGSRFEV